MAIGGINFVFFLIYIGENLLFYTHDNRATHAPFDPYKGID
jgi:hypothetical protein